MRGPPQMRSGKLLSNISDVSCNYVDVRPMVLAPPPSRTRRSNCSFATPSHVREQTAGVASAFARNAGEPSTSSSARNSTTGSYILDGSELQQQKPQRKLVLQRGSRPNTINWDRWEIMYYRRLQEMEREAAARAEEGGERATGDGDGSDSADDEDSSASSWLNRLAASDVSAAYFQRWDDPAVHQPLVQDRVLTAAWRDALAAAPPGSLQGKVVLDVGCGLGWLSMMVAKAGAARVIAVDGSAGAVEAARRIIKVNGLDDKITIVHGALETLTTLPGVSPREVDVVVSNWMGPGLMAGGMAHAVAHAVSTWLRPGGLVLPDSVSLCAVALEDRDALQEAKDLWSRMGGFDMSPALAQVIKFPRRDVITRKAQLLSAPVRLAEWRTAEWRTASTGTAEGPTAVSGRPVVDPETGAYATCPFSLTITRDERLFGLVLYWEAVWTFGGALGGGGGSAPAVRLSNHPLSASTHHQQRMLDFPRSMRVAADDVLAGELVLSPGVTDPRELQLELRAELRPAETEEAAEAEGKGQGGKTEVIRAQYRIPHASS